MPFEKGHPKTGGRKEGTPNITTAKLFEDLLKKMKAVEKNEVVSEGKSILEHFIERAYTNDTVLCALMKKLVADQQATKVDLENEREIIVIGMEEGKDARAKLTEKIELIAKRREVEMEDWTEEQWVDYIKEVQARKEKREVNK